MNQTAPYHRYKPTPARPYYRKATPSTPAPLDRVIFYAVLFAGVYSLATLLVYFVGYFRYPALSAQAVPVGLAITLLTELVFVFVELREPKRTNKP